MAAMLVASLPMYDFPWLRTETEALWRLLAARLRAAGMHGVPDRLRHAPVARTDWHDPNLMFGQACGYPYMSNLRGILRLIATPCYRLPGCVGPLHRSLIVVREDLATATLTELRGMRAAVNERSSNTGMNLLRLTLAELGTARDGNDPFFSEVIITHAHLWSLAALRTGTADLATIDCVTHGLVARHRPDLLEGTAVIGETAPSPALPFVMSTQCAPEWLEPVRTALHAMLADPQAAATLDALGIAGIETLTDADYQIVLDYERRAQTLGYPELR